MSNPGPSSLTVLDDVWNTLGTDFISKNGNLSVVTQSPVLPYQEQFSQQDCHPSHFQLEKLERPAFDCVIPPQPPPPNDECVSFSQESSDSFVGTSHFITPSTKTSLVAASQSYLPSDSVPISTTWAVGGEGNGYSHEIPQPPPLTLPLPFEHQSQFQPIPTYMGTCHEARHLCPPVASAQIIPLQTHLHPHPQRSHPANHPSDPHYVTSPLYFAPTPTTSTPTLTNTTLAPSCQDFEQHQQPQNFLAQYHEQPQHLYPIVQQHHQSSHPQHLHQLNPNPHLPYSHRPQQPWVSSLVPTYSPSMIPSTNQPDLALPSGCAAISPPPPDFYPHSQNLSQVPKSQQQSKREQLQYREAINSGSPPVSSSSHHERLQHTHKLPSGKVTDPEATTQIQTGNIQPFVMTEIPYTSSQPLPSTITKTRNVEPVYMATLSMKHERGKTSAPLQQDVGNGGGEENKTSGCIQADHPYRQIQQLVTWLPQVSQPPQVQIQLQGQSQFQLRTNSVVPVMDPIEFFAPKAKEDLSSSSSLSTTAPQGTMLKSQTFALPAMPSQHICQPINLALLKLGSYPSGWNGGSAGAGQFTSIFPMHVKDLQPTPVFIPSDSSWVSSSVVNTPLSNFPTTPSFAGTSPTISSNPSTPTSYNSVRDSPQATTKPLMSNFTGLGAGVSVNPPPTNSTFNVTYPPTHYQQQTSHILKRKAEEATLEDAMIHQKKSRSSQ